MRIREGIAIGLFVALILYVIGSIEDRIQREQDINHIRTYIQQWEERTEEFGTEYATRHATDDSNREVFYEDGIRLRSHRAAIEDLMGIVQWRMRHLNGKETHEILTTLTSLSWAVDFAMEGFEDHKPVSWPEYVAQYDCLVFSRIYRVSWLQLGELQLSHTERDS